MKRVISSDMLIDISGCYWDEDQEVYENVPNCTSNWRTVEDAAEAIYRYLKNAQVEVVIVDGDLEYWKHDNWSEDELINDLNANL